MYPEVFLGNLAWQRSGSSSSGSNTGGGDGGEAVSGAPGSGSVVGGVSSNRRGPSRKQKKL